MVICNLEAQEDQVPKYNCPGVISDSAYPPTLSNPRCVPFSHIMYRNSMPWVCIHYLTLNFTHELLHGYTVYSTTRYN